MNGTSAGLPPLIWAESGMAAGLPWLAWGLWLIVGFLMILPGIVAYMVWAERKIAGRFQDRIGPNRVGPFGLLQPVADAIKLITKENIVPTAADKAVHLIAPIILVTSAYLVMAVIPISYGTLAGPGRSRGLLPVDLPAGLLYLIAVSSLSSLGVFLAGWASRNKYSLLGGMRSVAQLVSYEIPQVLATVPIILWSGGLSLVRIVDQQTDAGLWNVFIPPGFLSFVILTIASIAEVNRTPFDLPEAESEIIAGFHTEYSSMRFGLFFMAEYMNVFAISCLGTVLFLGGGSLPIPYLMPDFPRALLGNSAFLNVMVNLLAIGIFLVKVVLYIFVMFWVRATLPRLRVDQMMNFAWKGLVPLSLVNIAIAAVWYEFAIRPATPHRLVGWLVTLVLTVLAVWALLSRLSQGMHAVPGGRRRVGARAPTTATITTAAAPLPR